MKPDEGQQFYIDSMPEQKMQCPLCRGEKKLGYICDYKPPELGDCYRCEGTGVVSSSPSGAKES